MNFTKGQVVIYEGHRCRIVELTGSTAMLLNLDPKDDSDWTTLEVKLLNIKEENHDE